MIWDDAPLASFTDFMAIGWDGGVLSPQLSSIMGTIVVNHSVTNTEETEYFYYSGEDKLINFTLEGNGLVWNIFNVYRDYNDYESPLYFLTHGSVQMPESLRNNPPPNIDIHTIEYRLIIKLDCSTANSFADINNFIVSSDYRHTYYKAAIGLDGITLRGYITGAGIAFLGVKITSTLTADDSRQNDINIIH